MASAGPESDCLRSLGTGIGSSNASKRCQRPVPHDAGGPFNLCSPLALAGWVWLPDKWMDSAVAAFTDTTFRLLKACRPGLP